MNFEAAPVFQAVRLDLVLPDRHALRDLSLSVHGRGITAVIGGAESGKSALLRAFCRMNEAYGPCSVQGSLLFHGEDVLSRDYDVRGLRKRVAYIAAEPAVFPFSVYQNMAWGLRHAGRNPSQGGKEGVDLGSVVELALEKTGLWSELKDKLHKPALSLSAGQQQRLCIARALAVGPEVLVLDEPSSTLDPLSSGRVESLLESLRDEITVILGTRNRQLASRLSDWCAYLQFGELVEYGPTKDLYINPKDGRTEAFLTGRFTGQGETSADPYSF